MKLNHFSSKRKDLGRDWLAGRPARGERILEAGWQLPGTLLSGGQQSQGSHTWGPGLPAVTLRPWVAHLCPRHLSPECRVLEVRSRADSDMGRGRGTFREVNLKSQDKTKTTLNKYPREFLIAAVLGIHRATAWIRTTLLPEEPAIEP